LWVILVFGIDVFENPGRQLNENQRKLGVYFDILLMRTDPVVLADPERIMLPGPCTAASMVLVLHLSLSYHLGSDYCSTTTVRLVGKLATLVCVLGKVDLEFVLFAGNTHERL
jgi:hypothetical protein